MIVNFNIQNFGSIKEKQTLSFEADRSTHLQKEYTVETVAGRLLKIALIYGANAAGKTTVLKALEFLRDLVLNPADKKTDALDFLPFLFDDKTAEENSVLSIEFVQNEIRYFYEVEFFRKAVVREELNFYSPKKSNVYRRTTDLESQFTEISFGNKIKKDKTFEKILEANTLWNNTVLGGFLKTNMDVPQLKAATDWFEHYLYPLVGSNTELEGYVTEKIDSAEIDKGDVVRILKKADFNISDIFIIDSSGRKKYHADMLAEARLPYFTKKGSSEVMRPEFEHTVGGVQYNLPLKSESEGTKRYYVFSGLLTLLLRNSIALPIDELEASLHPDLYLHFILSFLMNAQRSQIIATTHHRELLNDKDVFRNDAVWFADKGEDAATELYSLADFGTTVIRDTTNVLNAYKSGKLRGAPQLGDYYLDFD